MARLKIFAWEASLWDCAWRASLKGTRHTALYEVKKQQNIHHKWSSLFSCLNSYERSSMSQVQLKSTCSAQQWNVLPERTCLLAYFKGSWWDWRLGALWVLKALNGILSFMPLIRKFPCHQIQPHSVWTKSVLLSSSVTSYFLYRLVLKELQFWSLFKTEAFYSTWNVWLLHMKCIFVWKE